MPLEVCLLRCCGDEPFHKHLWASLVLYAKPRAPAVAAATRSQVFPDVPTVGEFLPGYESSVWLGLSIIKVVNSVRLCSSSHRGTRGARD
jgi:Tripartite tricarboxylate transporter family receptor